MTFLKANFPYYNEKMVSIPGISFQFSLNQHGIPEKAKEIRLKMEQEHKFKVGSKRKASPPDVDHMRGGKQRKKSEKSESELLNIWEQEALGQEAEKRVHDVLQKRFANEPVLLVHGFKENDLVKGSFHLKKTFSIPLGLP